MLLIKDVPVPTTDDYMGCPYMLTYDVLLVNKDAMSLWWITWKIHTYRNAPWKMLHVNDPTYKDDDTWWCTLLRCLKDGDQMLLYMCLLENGCYWWELILLSYEMWCPCIYVLILGDDTYMEDMLQRDVIRLVLMPSCYWLWYDDVLWLMMWCLHIYLGDALRCTY